MSSPIVPTDQDPAEATASELTDEQCISVIKALHAGLPNDFSILTTIPGLPQVEDNRFSSDPVVIWGRVKTRVRKELFGSLEDHACEGLELSSQRLGLSHDENFSKVDKSLISGILEAASIKEFSQDDMISFLTENGVWLLDLIPAQTRQIWKQEIDREAKEESEDRDPFYYSLKKYLCGDTTTDDVDPEGFITDNVVEGLSGDSQIDVDSFDVTRAAKLVLSNKLIPAMARTDEQRIEMQIALFVQVLNKIHIQNQDVDEGDEINTA